MLAFTIVYFSESGLFNALRPIQIRFSVWLPASVPIYAERLAVIAAIAGDALCRWLRSFKNHCASASDFRQRIVEKTARRPSGLIA
jgi:hypothetical protein